MSKATEELRLWADHYCGPILNATQAVLAELEQANERIKELEHESEMWDEHMSPFTDYEGDEAPWITIEREFTKMSKELEQAQAACDLFLLNLLEFFESIVANEQPNMHDLSLTKALVRISNGLLERERIPKAPVQAMSSKTTEGTCVHAGTPQATGGSISSPEGEKPGEIQKVLTGLPQEASGENPEGLQKSRSLQRAVQDNSTQCGCQRESEEAQNLRGLRMDRIPSWASSRLQQAIRRAMALHYLSREEAQKILSNFATDCGAAFLERLKNAEDERNRFRSILEGWRKYFEADNPDTEDWKESHADDFTRLWFETENALAAKA